MEKIKNFSKEIQKIQAFLGDYDVVTDRPTDQTDMRAHRKVKLSKSVPQKQNGQFVRDHQEVTHNHFFNLSKGLGLKRSLHTKNLKNFYRAVFEIIPFSCAPK